MGQAPAEVQALLREHTTTHQVNELHYPKKLPADPTLAGAPMIVFLNGAGQRGPADGSELDRACMHGVLKVAMAGWPAAKQSATHARRIVSIRVWTLCVMPAFLWPCVCV